MNNLQDLRKPFPDHQISYLPKGGTKLAYVGHAALTDRLLDVDPGWTWEPLAMSPHGLPVMDDLGGMWIRLTVCGVTRLGYGHAGNKQGGDAIKEIIGDALRNAAMRFGAALDLWHKGDLHLDVPVNAPAESDVPVNAPAESALQVWLNDFKVCATSDELRKSFTLALAAAINDDEKTALILAKDKKKKEL